MRVTPEVLGSNHDKNCVSHTKFVLFHMVTPRTEECQRVNYLLRGGFIIKFGACIQFTDGVIQYKQK